MGTATAGQIVVIVGKSSAGDWYQLDGGQWVAEFLVKLNEAAASPTPTALPVSDDTNAGDWNKSSIEQRKAIVHHFYEFWKKAENGNIGITEPEMMICVIDQVALPYTQAHPTMGIMSLASRCIKQ